MKTRLLSALLVTLLGSLGCAPPDDGSSGGGGSESTSEKTRHTNSGGGAADAGVEITAFARDLIVNHTLPTTTEDKHLIDVSPVSFGPDFFR